MSQLSQKNDNESSVVAVCLLMGLSVGFYVGRTVSGGTIMGSVAGMFPGLFIGMLFQTIANYLGSPQKH